MKILKKQLFVALTALALISIGCASDDGGSKDTDSSSNPDAVVVATDKEDLEIGFSGTDTISSVTADLTLAESGSNGTTISWNSDTPGVIANDGTVTRPTPTSGDATVVLIATITLNGETDTKTFTITVKAKVYKKIFLTAGTWSGGSVAGVSGADSKCSADTNNPGSGTYKAMIVDGTNRVACTSANCVTGGTSEGTDWVFIAGITYVQSDGTTELFTADDNGVYTGTLSTAISNWDNPSENDRAWTGLNTDWTSGSNNCTNWAESSGYYGAYSNYTYTAAWFGASGGDSCTRTFPLICVEQ